VNALGAFPFSNPTALEGCAANAPLERARALFAWTPDAAGPAGMEQSLLFQPFMNAIKGKRRVYWLTGVSLVILGFLVAALVLPLRETPDPGPHVDVPKMQNVPPPDQKLKLDVSKQQ
jgi:hypothetical protein